MACLNAILKNLSRDLQKAILITGLFLQIKIYNIPQMTRFSPSQHRIFTGHTFEGAIDQGCDKILEKFFVPFDAWCAPPIRH